MSKTLLPKSSSNTFFLVWFILASALAHFVFFGLSNEPADKIVDLSFSTPLSVTVISSRSLTSTEQKLDTKHSATNPSAIKSLKLKADTQAKESKKPRQIADKTVTHQSSTVRKTPDVTAISNKPKPDKIELSKTKPLTTEFAQAAKTTQASTYNKLRSHLQDQLRKAIKARFTYPRMARRMNWEGLVGLTLHIETDGTLRNIQIKRSSGHKILDENARKTIEKIARINVASGYTIQSTNTEVDVLYRLVE